MARDSFVSWYKMFVRLESVFESAPDECAGRALKASFVYARTGEVPELDPVSTILFSAIRPSIDDSAESFENISKRNRETAARLAVSLGARGYDYMCDWVGQNLNRLRPDVEQGDIYGLHDGDWAYIINSVFRRVADEAGYNPTALLSYLKGAGLIRTSGGKTSVPKRIRGSVVRCICLHLVQDIEQTDEECSDFEPL